MFGKTVFVNAKITQSHKLKLLTNLFCYKARFGIAVYHLERIRVDKGFVIDRPFSFFIVFVSVAFLVAVGARVGKQSIVYPYLSRNCLSYRHPM